MILIERARTLSPRAFNLGKAGVRCILITSDVRASVLQKVVRLVALFSSPCLRCSESTLFVIHAPFEEVFYGYCVYAQLLQIDNCCVCTYDARTVVKIKHLYVDTISTIYNVYLFIIYFTRKLTSFTQYNSLFQICKKFCIFYPRNRASI